MNPYEEFDNSVSMNTSTERMDTPLTTFGENFDIGVGEVFDEEMSTSRWLNNGAYRERNKLINKLHEDGEITPDEWAASRRSHGRGMTMDYDALANIAISKGYNKEFNVNMMNDSDINENIREDLKLRRDYREDVRANATAGGDVGYFVGSMAAYPLDPVNAVSMFAVPAKAYQGLSILQRIGMGAAAGVASEAAIQPFVYEWKEDIGVEYTGRDAMMNIAMAGGFGGTIDGVVAGMGKALKGMTAKKIAEYDDAELPEALKAMEFMTRELKQAPDPKMDAAEYVQTVDDQIRSLNEGKPAKVEYEDSFYAKAEDPEIEATYKAQAAEDIDSDIVVSIDVSKGEASNVTRKASEVIQEMDDQVSKLESFRACQYG